MFGTPEDVPMDGVQWAHLPGIAESAAGYGALTQPDGDVDFPSGIGRVTFDVLLRFAGLAQPEIKHSQTSPLAFSNTGSAPTVPNTERR